MLNYDNTSTLSWSLLPYTTHNIPRGKEPKWYKQLIQLIIDSDLITKNNRLQYSNLYIINDILLSKNN